MLHEECSCQKIKFYLPLDLADKIAKTLEKKAEKSGEKPMMTTFSVYNLARNNDFDYSKAQKELGYTTRTYAEAIHDEVEWLKAEGLIKADNSEETDTNKKAQEENKMAKFEKMNKKIEKGVVTGYKKIEEGVVEGYKKIEEGVVSGYKKIEEGAVEGFQKVSDKFVDKFFTKEGESVEEAKKRLAGEKEVTEETGNETKEEVKEEAKEEE